MKILRTILLLILIVAGIALASVNMAPVKFFYLPPFQFMPRPEGAAIDIPLALLLLAALVAGALIAGTGTFVEHARLRFAVRRQAKVNGKLRADVERLTSELDQARSALEAKQVELAAAQTRADRAEEEATKAQLEAARHRARAEELAAQAEAAAAAADADIPALPDITPAQ
ncbi:MAG TPA: lipopolysaccharide assembly protein LapA domain-containing protein [Candidatus Limnocylindrales bacterium]|nr:lipopolysaccharide assembly protein LapA domain-containing protein [Candidatus Limnocylindrales bacterium]